MHIKVADINVRVIESSVEGRDEKTVVTGLQNLEYIPVKIELLEKKNKELKDFFSLFTRISIKEFKDYIKPAMVYPLLLLLVQ